MQEFYATLGMSAPDEPTSRPGRCVTRLLRIGRPDRDRWTGIGFNLYAADGRLLQSWFAPGWQERAADRGDAIPWARTSADELESVSLKILAERWATKLADLAAADLAGECPAQFPFAHSEILALSTCPGPDWGNGIHDFTAMIEGADSGPQPALLPAASAPSFWSRLWRVIRAWFAGY